MQECVALEELYLSHNGIVKMEGLSTLVNLKVLDVASNKLTEISDIDKLGKYDFYFTKSIHYSNSLCPSILLILFICVQARRSVA